jgi:solute carrier family 39 (zinc transporter), member 7
MLRQEGSGSLTEEQKCLIVQELSGEKAAHNAGSDSAISRLFDVLFPGSPAVNALLATLYISGPPNFLLALCPTNIDPSSLSVMVAFAVGGLLGDTLFHLLPEIFLGEDSPDRARFVLVEPNRNLLLGVAIMVGFLTFVAMDKGLRIATGGAGHDHGSGHSHEHRPDISSAADTTALDKSDAKGVRNRGTKGSDAKADSTQLVPAKEVSPSVKLGGYLNLM